MKNILLLEPNLEVAQIVKDFLERDGKVNVFVAYTSQDGIFTADAHTPDLVIVELAIPMHNGFAFLHEFRSYEDWSNIPVIIHSHLARDEAAMSKSWKILGTEDYFYKPKTTLMQLKKRVYEVLGL